VKQRFNSNYNVRVRFLAIAAAALISCVMLPQLCAETVTIKVVNGRNGRPMSKAPVNVWTSNESKDANAIQTDGNGIAQIHPVDARVDLRIQVGYVLCQAPKGNHSWLFVMTFPTHRVLEQGMVTANYCGKATAAPQAGEITILVRPLTWWEMLKE
jgi:hypothetical protein